MNHGIPPYKFRRAFPVTNAGTIATTLPAPVASAVVRNVEHLSGTVTATLPAPVSSAQAIAQEHALAIVAAILPAPVVSSMVVEVEHVTATIHAALPAPAVSAVARNVEHDFADVHSMLPAPHARGVATNVPPHWRINWAAARSSAPRLYKRHLRYRQSTRVRYSGQMLAFVNQQALRLNFGHDFCFACLHKWSATQITDLDNWNET